MKTIGIKLADGSFYPILQENTPSEKALELTTAHNNQTKIMVDLYRSATCTMDDAEYVDSLQIDNLVAHPNGEPDISFTVSIDNENKLSAKIVDPETGNQSNTSITLVSRTVEERLVTDEYDINDLKVKKAAAAGGLLAAASLIAASQKSEEEPVIEENSIIDEPAPTYEETSVEDQSIDDTVVNEMPVEENNLSDETITDEVISEEIAFEEPVSTDTSADETIAEDTVTDEVPVNDDLSFDLPEDTVSEESNFNEPFATETSTDETIVSENFDEPIIEENAETFDGDGSEIIIDDEIADESVSEDDMDLDFSMPDITSDISTDTENPATETQDDFFNMNDIDTNSGENMDFNDDQPSGNGISFTGLYDKETEFGESASSSEVEEVVKKKTKVPVIICIICAIICILATVLILFVIPSKYNLITKKAEKETVVEKIEPIAEQETESVIEETVPEAKEEEIVVIEKAEEVVPEQPPVAEEKPADITYKIKWGDTLWDIADTYYKNPWRYKYIARFNGIKNPDYIISGTYITIPAE